MRISIRVVPPGAFSSGSSLSKYITSPSQRRARHQRAQPGSRARAVGSDAGLRRTGSLGPGPSAPTCVHAGCSHEGPFSVRREHVHPSPGGWRPGTSGQVPLHLTAGQCGSEARPARLRARLEVTVTLATPTLAPQRVCLGEGHQFMVRALPLTLGLISMAGNI